MVVMVVAPGEEVAQPGAPVVRRGKTTGVVSLVFEGFEPFDFLQPRTGPWQEPIIGPMLAQTENADSAFKG